MFVCVRVFPRVLAGVCQSTMCERVGVCVSELYMEVAVTDLHRAERARRRQGQAPDCPRPHPEISGEVYKGSVCGRFMRIDPARAARVRMRMRIWLCVCIAEDIIRCTIHTTLIAFDLYIDHITYIYVLADTRCER